MNLLAAKQWITHELLDAGIEDHEARREAELIIEHVTGWKLATQVLQAEETLADPALSSIRELVDKRRQRLPLQYAFGQASFRGRDFEVKPGVFIPRPDTETVLETAINSFPPTGTIAEIGTGSGAILISLLLEKPQLFGVGVELSEEAFEVTRTNAIRHGVFERMTLIKGDWRSVLPGQLDGIVSNPPYIPLSQQPELQPEVRLYEPSLALFGSDTDGLGFYRELSARAAGHMKKSSYLVLEVGDQQSAEVEQILRGDGWLSVESQKDIHGIRRAVRAQSGLTDSQK